MNKAMTAMAALAGAAGLGSVRKRRAAAATRHRGVPHRVPRCIAQMAARAAPDRAGAGHLPGLRPRRRACFLARGGGVAILAPAARSVAPPIEQLQAVNRSKTDWRYKADDQNYGRRDYWATPLEFLRYSGDCEDGVAKYVSLRQLGFTADQLRLVVVYDVVRDLAHRRACRLPGRRGVCSRQSDQRRPATGPDR